MYSPISFGKKTDPNGDYIRHFIPALKNMPKKYVSVRVVIVVGILVPAYLHVKPIPVDF